MLAKSLQAAAGNAGGDNPNAWDISNAVYDAGTDAWDIFTALYRLTANVSAQEVNPEGLSFKPDGTKMYVLGTGSDAVNEYSLSTAWNIDSKSYVQNFSVIAQDTVARGLFFKTDGTKMYVVGATNDSVYEYTLSTAWDISTASYVQNFSVTSQDTDAEDVFFKPDGTKMYVIGSGNDSVYEYSLSTAWDISTASYVQAFSVAAQETTPTALFFKPDGTKMYVLGDTGNDLGEYSLPTAWDISTASYAGNINSISTQDTLPQGLFFKPDGSAFYMAGGANDSVYSYVLGGFKVTAQEASPTGLFFKSDGTEMYVIGIDGDDVNQYSLSTAWDVYSASYVQNFSVAGQETNPTDLFFKPDGTKMYIVGSAGDEVNEYSLSTAWDISTASYVQTFSVAAQDTSPLGLFFKPDGTKMYVLGASGDDVNEYTLSTAWDISTASYVQTFSVAAQDTSPQSLSFKPDGTKMYVLGASGDDVNEYTLSTAWDISTASYFQNFSVMEQCNNPTGIFFKEDGTQFFIVDSQSARIFPYTIE